MQKDKEHVVEIPYTLVEDMTMWHEDASSNVAGGDADNTFWECIDKNTRAMVGNDAADLYAMVTADNLSTEDALTQEDKDIYEQVEWVRTMLYNIIQLKGLQRATSDLLRTIENDFRDKDFDIHVSFENQNALRKALHEEPSVRP